MAISFRESVRVGLTDIWVRKVRSIVTVMGIVLGTMSIVVVLSIVEGVKNSSLSWMTERGGLKKIEVQRDWSQDQQVGVNDFFSLEEVQKIKTLLPEVEAFNAQLETYTTLKVGKYKFDGSVMGVYPDYQVVEEWTPTTGRFINDFDESSADNVILIGTKVKQALFGSRNAVGQSIIIGNQSFTVIGIMEEKKLVQPNGGMGDQNFLDYMNEFSFIPLTSMQKKIAKTSPIRGFSVRVKNLNDSEAVSKKIENILLNMRQGKHVFSVESAKEQAEKMQKQSLLFEMIFFFIAAISLIVGGIVIMNIMLASIQERTREIGVRLAIGARRWDIFLQFLVQTVLVTSIGGVFGIVIGISITGLVGTFLKTQVSVAPSMILIAFMVSAGVGLIFGIFPAVRASKLDPVKALRNE